MLLKHTHQIFRAHRYQRLPTRLHASAGRDGSAEASEGMPGAAKLACASAVLKSHPFVHSLIPSRRMGLGHLPRGQMLEQAPELCWRPPTQSLPAWGLPGIQG